MDPFQPVPPPRQRPPLHSVTSSNSLSRISTVSDFADLESIPLHARPSLVSLQSEHPAHSGGEDSHIYNSAPSSWSTFTGYPGGGGYEPVPVAGSPPPRRQQSRAHTNAAPLRRHQEAIPEEEDWADLGLMQSATPLDGGHATLSPPPAATRESFIANEQFEAFDISSALGPTTKADEAFMKALREQEATGRLTGGLGTGIRTEAVVTESALLAAEPAAEKMPLVRSFSRSLHRRSTVKELGQHEANKRGEVIEVIMDRGGPSQSEVDLSIMAGPETLPGISHRLAKAATFPTAAERTQIFYPQQNWKPFSMRWPYLVALIVISIVLGAAQEVLFRASERKPLLSFHEPSEIPGGQYFAFKFLPTLVAVSYGVLWQVTDFEVKRLEAFYQMSKEGGALAAESINVDYITYFSFFRPFRAFRCKHYAVTISTITALLANALVPTLSAACIVLSPDRDTRTKFPAGEKTIQIHYVWSRLLTVTLFIIAALGCVLLYQLQTRRSGLLADVRGIAGLAAMATVSHILMDFKDMDVATHKDIHDKLNDHRYVLRNSSLAPDDLNPPSKQERDRYTENHLSENPQPLMLRSKGVIPYISGITLFIILLPVFLFTPATAITDKAPWFITALAVCIKLGWGGLESDVRMMEPFFILSRRHAPPKTLTLDYTAMPFGWVALRGLMNGHWVVFAVGFGTIMTELLTVLVTSLATVEGRVFIELIHKSGGGTKTKVLNGDDDEPVTTTDINSGQETPASFWVSLTIALLILAYMGIVAGVVFVRRRRVFLPRQPNTIASVLAYIHQSKMLYDFVGTAKLSNAEMVKRLESIGKTYGLGWFQGRDGQSHCGVDEEELLSGYKFGYDYSRATKPWEEEQVHWL